MFVLSDRQFLTAAESLSPVLLMTQPGQRHVPIASKHKTWSADIIWLSMSATACSLEKCLLPDGAKPVGMLTAVYSMVSATVWQRGGKR